MAIFTVMPIMQFWIYTHTLMEGICFADTIICNKPLHKKKLSALVSGKVSTWSGEVRGGVEKSSGGILWRGARWSWGQRIVVTLYKVFALRCSAILCSHYEMVNSEHCYYLLSAGNRSRNALLCCPMEILPLIFHLPLLPLQWHPVRLQRRREQNRTDRPLCN